MTTSYAWTVDVIRKFPKTVEDKQGNEKTIWVPLKNALRKLTLTAQPGKESRIWPRHMKIVVRVNTGARPEYNLHGRKETTRPWWEGDEPIIADNYTLIEKMDRFRLLVVLKAWLGDDYDQAVFELDHKEPPARKRKSA